MKDTIKIFQATSVLANFKLDSPIMNIKPFGSGHINETYLVEYESERTKYILQKINNHVFTRVDLLMDNILKVTSHIKKNFRKTIQTAFRTK